MRVFIISQQERVDPNFVSKVRRRFKLQDFSKFIREIPDFPEPGILFKDITPLLGNGEVFQAAIEVLASRYEPQRIDKVVGIDARGFILGAALAYRLGVGFVPIRKAGKLPTDTYQRTYDLEYGDPETLSIHQDAFSEGCRVLICDDVLATGGTLAAAVDLVQQLRGDIVGIALLIELTFLNGREKISGYDILSILEY